MNEPANQDECNLAMLCHPIALVGLVIPLGNLLGPLIVWLLKRDQSHFVDMHGKEALNFNISMALAFLVSSILTAIFIGFVLMFVVGIFWFVLALVAASRASAGASYTYPLTLRLVQ